MKPVDEPVVRYDDDCLFILNPLLLLLFFILCSTKVSARVGFDDTTELIGPVLTGEIFEADRYVFIDKLEQSVKTRLLYKNEIF